MKFEKILFHTRFRDAAFKALESILELKKAGLKEVVLTYILPKEELTFVPYGGYLKDEEERLKEIARTRFEEWKESICKQGIECKIIIETGIPNAAILSIAEKEKVDMIVTGRKKRTGVERVYVGSHILDILRRTSVPVLMGKFLSEFIKNGETLTKTNKFIFTRPLIATDWSSPSKNTLDAVAGFKGAVETVIVTHNIDDKISKRLNSSGLKEIEDESKKRLKEYCGIIEKNGINALSHLCFGKTVEEIINASREYEATMIVMGKTGKDWFQEYWLGGVSHRVAELSELPVLLIP